MKPINLVYKSDSKLYRIDSQIILSIKELKP